MVKQMKYFSCIHLAPLVRLKTRDTIKLSVFQLVHCASVPEGKKLLLVLKKHCHVIVEAHSQVDSFQSRKVTL